MEEDVNILELQTLLKRPLLFDFLCFAYQQSMLNLRKEFPSWILRVREFLKRED